MVVVVIMSYSGFLELFAMICNFCIKVSGALFIGYSRFCLQPSQNKDSSICNSVSLVMLSAG